MGYHTVGHFISQTGIKLFEQSWRVDVGQPLKGSVILVHGINEYSGRYAHVADYLNQHGYDFFTYDHQGFGRSEGERGEVGSFDVLRHDLLHFIQRVKQQRSAESKPLFVLGHSMGGAVVAYTAVTDLLDVDGVILSGAALMVNRTAPRLLVKMAPLLGRFLPKMAAPSQMDGRLLSRDEVMRADRLRDKLVIVRPMSMQTAAEIIRAIGVIRANCHKFAHRLFIWHGTADKVTEPEGSLQFYARVTSADKTLKLYEGYFHECHNDIGREHLFADLVTWLDNHLETAASNQKHHTKRTAKRKELPVNQKAL